MTRSATISFVIPVRNDAPRLAGCLESIARLDYPHHSIEVIVLDDGSSDDSAEVARRAGAIVVHPAHSTVGELRNRGARVARGEILAFIDADHELDPGWAGAAVATLACREVGATGALYQTPVNATWVQLAYDALRGRTKGRGDVEWLASGNVAVRRDAFEAIGGFDGSLETCEDVDFCRRLRAGGRALIGDERLRSVHYGDPATLAGLFAGELWRGRDNLRVSLRPPFTPGILVSAAIPVMNLATLVVGAIALPMGRPAIALGAAALVAGLAALRAVRMATRRARVTPLAVCQMFLVAGAYDLARALAIVARAGHGVRRAVAAPLQDMKPAPQPVDGRAASGDRR